MDERVLVLVKGARDGELTRDLLLRDGVDALLCATMSEVCERIDEGAACLVIAEETLTKESMDELSVLLAAQPAWSDFPLVVFSAMARGDTAAVIQTLGALGNVILLDRPIQVRSMLASVQAALRSRRRQYEARGAIDARDKFLAMLGHELRNPLAAIRMAVAILDGKYEPGARPKELAIADRQSEHLTHLVDDLLDVARVTHGKISLQRGALDLVDVVREAFEALEPRAKQRGIACALRAPTTEIWIDGDRARLDQVFANLLSNAVKYTPPGGTIAVDVNGEGERAFITIADTGIGLAPEMLERIFDIFTQADVSRERAQGGIGLGLALVRSLVRLHDGDVEAASAGLGRGATFCVHLPRRSTVPSQLPPPESEPACTGSKRIVVVEDNNDVRELLQEILEQAGHEVACAEDGPRGVDRILSFEPDIAFVDLGLPVFDGLELARRVRAAGATVRLVAVTGYGQETDKEQTARAGFDDHLTKPVRLADVERAIRRGDAR